jgi:citrate synthase
MHIQDVIADQIPAWRERTSRLRKDHGFFKIGEVTVDQILGGIRGVQISISDVSYVDPMEGVRFRGYTIPETLEKLPKAQGTRYPMMGGLYYLLLSGQLPTHEEAMEIENEWKTRSTLPDHVVRIIHSMPKSTHPMTLYSQGILALQTDSTFSKTYNDTLPRNGYWTYFLEDSLNLTAKLPALAALIYNFKYQDSKYIPPDPNLDWSANFAHMIGKDDHEYQDLCRLFFVLHSDHEGANVSAHATHLVCSALSDIYLSCSAGMNGLAGPLHGLANQECLRWLLSTREHFNGVPDKLVLAAYLRELLEAGNTIPGYGHAVLRTTDPRFTAQLEFAEEYLPDDELLTLVKRIYSVLPHILKENGKVKNPYPNVDAINGTLQYHYGVREFDFYTVLFGVSRCVGLTTHAIWSRALVKPIERPKSLTTQMLEDMIAGVGK